MKRIIILAAMLSLYNCNKKEEVTEEKSGGISDMISGVKNYRNVANSMEDVTKNIEKLKAMTPLSKDELKAVLPENLMGIKRTELSVGDASMMNLSSAEARYDEEGGKKIKLQIMDGAGETGSAMISILMMGLNADREKTTTTGFEKTTELNGMKAMVSEEKNGDQVNSEIQVIAKDRYLVTLNGEGISYDDLSKVLTELNLSQLK